MRGTRFLIAVVLSVVATGLLLVHTCAAGGAMAAAYETCDCRGVAWTLYDRTAADGPRKTLCIGIVAARQCYQFMGGPEVPCPP